ncbi:hypothetical protein FP744_10007646 [Trichoderma asperellum]
MPAFSARNAQKSAIPTERQPQPLIDPVQFHHQAPRAKAAKTSRDWGIGSGLALVREPQVSLPAHKALALEVPVLVGRSFRGHVPKLAQALCLTIAPEPDAICALLCCFVAERKEPGCPLKRAKEGTALG